jgi:hypothetical protein
MKRVSLRVPRGRTRLQLFGIAVTFTIALLVALLVVLLRAEAQPAAGTMLVGNIDRSLTSADAQVGQSFKLTDVRSTNHDIEHATVLGHVAHVQRAGQGTKADIGLAYDKLTTASGTVYHLEARTADVAAETKKNTGKEAGATAGGALVGGLIGGGVGAVLGAGTGFLVSSNSKQNVTIPKGAHVSINVVQARKQTAQ